MTRTQTNGSRPRSITRSPSDAHSSPRRGADLIEALLEYELYSAWWADHIPFRWAQRLAGRYIAWKVARKTARYRARIEAARAAGR